MALDTTNLQMKDIILTTAYFAPISYFAAIAQSNSVNIERLENYQKKSYRSRCYIAGPHGKQMLNIPIERPNKNNTKIQEALVGINQNWQNQHWNSIITAYNSSPFLLYYENEIKEVFFKDYDNLWELNNNLLELFMDLLQINKSISYTNEYNKTYVNISDLRNSISPKKIINNEKYIQVFGDKNGFINDLSILDLLFNLGPEASTYLMRVNLG